MKKILNILLVALCASSITALHAASTAIAKQTPSEAVQSRIAIKIQQEFEANIGRVDFDIDPSKVPSRGTFISLTSRRISPPLPYQPRNSVTVGKDMLIPGRYYYLESDSGSKLFAADVFETESNEGGGAVAQRGILDYNDPDDPYGIFFKGFLCPSNEAPCISYVIRSNSYNSPMSWVWTNSIQLENNDILLSIWPESCHIHTNHTWTNGYFSYVYKKSNGIKYTNYVVATVSTSVVPVIANGRYLLYSIHQPTLERKVSTGPGPLSLVLETNLIVYPLLSTNEPFVYWWTTEEFSNVLHSVGPQLPPNVVQPPLPWVPGMPADDWARTPPGGTYLQGGVNSPPPNETSTTNSYVLKVAGIPGSSYEIQTTGDLSGTPIWTTERSGTLDGRGRANVLIDPPDLPAKFYRLQYKP